MLVSSLCFIFVFISNFPRSWYRWSGSSSCGRHSVCGRLLFAGHPHPLPPYHWAVRRSLFYSLSHACTHPHTHTLIPLQLSSHNLQSHATTRSLLMDSLLPPSRHSYFPNGWTNFLPNYSACNACTSSLLHSINFHRLAQTVVSSLFLVHRVLHSVPLINKLWKMAQLLDTLSGFL